MTNSDGQSSTDNSLFSYYPGTLGFSAAHETAGYSGPFAVGDFDGNKVPLESGVFETTGLRLLPLCEPVVILAVRKEKISQ